MYAPGFSLKGKVAVVTGARRGIGRGVALGFAEVGADVAICDLVAGEELEAVAREIRKMGRRCVAGKVDCTKKAEVDSFFKKAEAELGSIDILFNSVGIAGGPPVIDQSEEEWDKIIATNLKSCYLCCKAVLPGMRERKKGNIISVASAAGIRGFSERNAYNVSKAGIIMLTKIMARDLGKYNIRANAIAPTMIKTDMTKWLTDNPEAVAAEARRTPLGRLGEVMDVVGPAIFLASDASSYITGDTIVVDGGQLA